MRRTTMSRLGRRAFTLVELLIVIFIIGLLVALLMPVLQKARRKALVLVSPVAAAPGYPSGDMGNALYLMSPSGNYVEVYRMRKGGAFKADGLHWSPSGQKVALQAYAGRGTEVHVVNPLTAAVKVVETVEYENFAGWVDDSHIATYREKLRIYDAETGALTRTIDFGRDGWYFDWISPAPPHAKAPYVGRGTRTGYDSVIALVRKDFTLGKIIWSQPSSKGSAALPKAEPMGDWVAWTEWRSGGGSYNGRIAMKRITDPAETPPTYPLPNLKGFFHDWTENGNMLAVVVLDNEYTLVVLDKNGRISYQIEKGESLRHETRSWRKYGHQ